MSGSGRKSRLRRFLVWFLKQSLKLVTILVFLTIIQVALLRYVDPPFTAMMAWYWIQEKAGSQPSTSPLHQWRDLKDISPWLIKAVLAGEDQRFVSHHGFDFIEMNQALQDILRNRRIRGASTISMQVARTVFLWPGRSYVRKAAEAYYTVLIELLWGKTRILEMYLNLVDWGTGVMGAEAASMKYFRTTSAGLTPSQAALLAAILPSPHRWSPTNPNAQVRERQRRIRRDMNKMHL